MDAAFASGRIADLVAGLMLVECLALGLLRRHTGRGMVLSRIVPMLLAGAFLVLALRGALTDASTTVIGAALAGAGIAHAVDLALRWRDATQPNGPVRGAARFTGKTAPDLEGRR